MIKNTPQTGYPWRLLDLNRSWLRSFLVTATVVALSILIFILYSRNSPDLTPDSILGYLYATLGTACMLMATFSYALFRHSRKRKVGKLNGALYWHISFGTMALVILTLHSFGNFNPRSGTYALYGMIALVFSGFIGRALDRTMPRLIAMAASKALTEQGEDRAEHITKTLESIVDYNTQDIRSFELQTVPEKAKQPAVVNRGDSILQSSWDLAYISLEETPQEVKRDSSSYRFVPDRKSPLAQPGALVPGVQDHMGELQTIEKALKNEQFYRSIVRFWRMFHVSLMLVTIGLTLWHLEYAAQLLIPTLFRH